MTRRTFIDGNSMCYAAQNRRGGPLSAGGRETTAIYGAVQSMRKRLDASAKPVILWDGRSWRHSRFAEYKANRTDTPEKRAERARYKAQRKDIARGLHLLGIPQLIASNLEADDLAAMLTRKALANGDTVRLITGDGDWQQLVQPGVVWVDHRTEKHCTSRNFAEITGLNTPRAFIDAKALRGDTSDNIKPRTGIAEKGAIELLNAFGSVDAFRAIPDDEILERWTAAGLKLTAKGELPKKYQSLRDDQELYERFDFARSLMDLNHPSIPKPQGMKLTKAQLNIDGFKKFCAELAFHSILNRFDHFIQPFVSHAKEFA